MDIQALTVNWGVVLRVAEAARLTSRQPAQAVLADFLAAVAAGAGLRSPPVRQQQAAQAETA